MKIRYFCLMKKEYELDNDFKKSARALQFKIKEELHDDSEVGAPKVLLSEENAAKGLIFYEGFRDLIMSKSPLCRTCNKMTANMLRSEHIPYNFFTPLETMPEVGKALFTELIGVEISKITDIRIEYAGNKKRSYYLNDGTSFDAFIAYESVDGHRGGIGIEVKYTEESYPLGVKEKRDIENPDGLYGKMTMRSGYYKNNIDIKIFLKAHHLRQIWRNHILGYSMIAAGDIDIFHHMHVYPKGNTHFHGFAVPEYEEILSDKGATTFIPLTYEHYFDLLESLTQDVKAKAWIKYLRHRYLY